MPVKCYRFMTIMKFFVIFRFFCAFSPRKGWNTPELLPYIKYRTTAYCEKTTYNRSKGLNTTYLATASSGVADCGV